MRGPTQHLYYHEKALVAFENPLDTSIIATDAAKVTIFHPPPDVTTNSTHLLFIPPLYCSDLSLYAEKLSKLADERQSILYALVFPEEPAEHDRSLLQMITDALRLCRGGSTRLEIIVCERETYFNVLRRDKGWRKEPDSIRMFESLE